MRPIDILDPMVLEAERARLLLRPGEYEVFLALGTDEREALLRELVTGPIGHFTVINELYFRARWAEVVGRLHGDGPLTLLEVAAGDADMIPQMLARVHPGSVYCTANMNRILNESMLAKLHGVANLQVDLIDDDAANIRTHVGDETVDMVAFQHGVNDVIQAMLCGRAGIDTVLPDWGEVILDMVRLVNEEVQAGTLEAHIRPVFVGLLRDLLAVLRPGGVMALHHYPFQCDLDWGYPPALYEGMIPMVRSWLADLADCREIRLDGFDGQWWLFVRKAGPG